MLEAFMPQNDSALGARLMYEQGIVLSFPKVLEVRFLYVNLNATDSLVDLSDPSHAGPYLPYEPSPLSYQDHNTAMENFQWEEDMLLPIIEQDVQSLDFDDSLCKQSL